MRVFRLENAEREGRSAPLASWNRNSVPIEPVFALHANLGPGYSQFSGQEIPTLLRHDSVGLLSAGSQLDSLCSNQVCSPFATSFVRWRRFWDDEAGREWRSLIEGAGAYEGIGRHSYGQIRARLATGNFRGFAMSAQWDAAEAGRTGTHSAWGYRVEGLLHYPTPDVHARIGLGLQQKFIQGDGVWGNPTPWSLWKRKNPNLLFWHSDAQIRAFSTFEWSASQEISWALESFSLRKWEADLSIDHALSALTSIGLGAEGTYAISADPTVSRWKADWQPYLTWQGAGPKGFLGFMELRYWPKGGLGWSLGLEKLFSNFMDDKGWGGKRLAFSSLKRQALRQ